MALTARVMSSIFQSESPVQQLVRGLRSEAVIEAIRRASETKTTPNVVLYNYPSFSGAYGALFAHLYHFRLNLPCLILPFSPVAPLSVEDLCFEGIQNCYFLDFVGPEGFVLELSKRTSSKVIVFDHRKSVLSRIPSREYSVLNIAFHVNIQKSSSFAAYEYFSTKFSETRFGDNDTMILLNQAEEERLETVLKYIEDGDLRKYSLPDIRAFGIGLKEWRAKLNCITNSCMYQQLMELCAVDLIKKGNAYLSSRRDYANKLLDKVFILRLGRGFYGECLGVRADGHSDFSDEIGKELSQRSMAAGLRPIGAVVYMQRNNLKMCLRTIDCSTDTSEVAKAYGGGGSASSSSFIIRMDEYNHWITKQLSSQH